MDMTGNNGIVNDLIELALKVPRTANPPLCYNGVYIFLRNLGDVVRAVPRDESNRTTAVREGLTEASGMPVGAHGAKCDR